MLGDVPVINGVVHPYDLGRGNRNPEAANQIKNIYHHHEMWQPAGRGFVMPESHFISDIDYHAIAHALFAESPVDVAVLHALPSLGFTTGPVSHVDRLAKLREEYAGRFLLYGTVHTPVVNDAIEDFRRQLEEHHVDGLKLYPVMFYGGRAHGWKMDDPDFTLPLIQAAHDMGIRNVAVHKAISVGRTRIEPFRVADVEVAAAAFSDVSFQIVHAGLAFLEETCLLMHRFKNVYANLEIPWNFSATRPRVFAELLGELLYWASPSQIIYGDGCNLVHPLPGIEAFAEFEMPEDLVRDRGYPTLSDDDKRLILGGNIARLHGLDVDAMRQLHEGDEFDVARADGLQAPWSQLRAELVGEPQ